MKRVFLIVLLHLAGSPAAPAQAPLKVTPVDNAPAGFDRLFAKQVRVFGLAVFATRGTPDDKVLHAANVLAQYLDNDGDGRPDNPRVMQALRESRGAVAMYATEREADETDVHRYIAEAVWDRMCIIGLYGEETRPGGAARGFFDATHEEVLHLVTQAGYARAYPDIFGERPGTAIARAMDKARGGHFRKVPRKYPDGAWFTYNDRTCDYASQITEYTYWGLTSILGAQDFPGRREEIANEWRLNTAAKVRDSDPALYALLTDPTYAFPKRLPDGKYNPRKRDAGADGRPAGDGTGASGN